jgi:hypothetical protein
MGSVASTAAKMRKGRRVALPLVATVVLAFGGLLAAVAGATTGPGFLLKPPKHRIPLSVLTAYTGRYVSSSVAQGSGIVSSELYIGRAQSGYAAGGISIYGYDPQGMLQTFAGTLYDFRLVGKSVEADIVSSDGTTVLGHVIIRHEGSSRNLVGTLQPPTGTGLFAVTYRYAASEVPLPGQAYAPAGTSSAAASTPKPGASSKPQLGWGAPASFLGRYRLIVSTPVAQPPAPAGIFSVAVAAADRLAAGAQTPSAGELTLFMRTVKKTEPPVPSGILSLVTPVGSYVLYLTDLQSAGLMRIATVHGGAFVGPATGMLRGTSGGTGTLTADVTARGIGTFSARFVRFSLSPNP